MKNRIIALFLLLGCNLMIIPSPHAPSVKSDASAWSSKHNIMLAKIGEALLCAGVAFAALADIPIRGVSRDGILLGLLSVGYLYDWGAELDRAEVSIVDDAQEIPEHMIKKDKHRYHDTRKLSVLRSGFKAVTLLLALDLSYKVRKAQGETL